MYQTLLIQLRRQHSEIRLSSFQLLKEIFERSHHFRTLVLEDLQVIFEHTLETNEIPLPPPKKAAKNLRILSAETMHQWVKKYGSTYRKLEHGYNYLKQVKRASFNDIEGRSEIERLREEEKKIKMDKVWKERVKRIKNELEESYADMEDCLTQLNNCIELLLPKPDNFLFSDDQQAANKEDQNEDNDDLQSHGILDAKTKISIDLNLNPQG